MPELPEVETVRRQLEGALTGKTFSTVEKLEASMLRDCSPEQVRADLPGRRVQDVGRLGKFLVIALSDGLFLTLHLGMTGQLLVGTAERDGEGGDTGPGKTSAGGDAFTPLRPSPQSDRHRRFLFTLTGDGGSRLFLEFRDMRKFGRVHLTAGGPAPRLENLGPDAWKGSWDGEYLRRRLERRMVALKAFLLDQRHLAGIGNIYADEILWWTGLSPFRPSGSLSNEEIARLAAEIPKRLGEGVRLLGCSLSDFVDTEGRSGSFQDWLRAYGRHGQVCFRCGAVLERAVVGGRGTAFCPGCQH